MKRKPIKKSNPAPLPTEKQIELIPAPDWSPPESPKATIDLIPAVNWGRP